MSSWIPFVLAAVVVWAVQRIATKLALVRWSTPYFYRLNALLSLAAYLPYAAFNPPQPEGLPGALGLSCLMAITFWVTTEATRRGPVGYVAPLTSMSPAITAVLAVALLGERPTLLAGGGVVLAIGASALLAYRPAAPQAMAGWIGLATLSLVLQGLGAFIAKLVVTGGGPTDLLLASVAVQLAVGMVLARRESLAPAQLMRGPGLAITATLLAAALATIGYLHALSVGPASLVVPLVATSPALAGLLAIIVLREPSTRRQLIGIALGAVAVVLLATS